MKRVKSYIRYQSKKSLLTLKALKEKFHQCRYKVKGIVVREEVIASAPCDNGVSLIVGCKEHGPSVIPTLVKDEKGRVVGAWFGIG